MPETSYLDVVTPAALSNGVPVSATGPGFLKCAVALANGPTAVLWGTVDAPSGWQVLYAGYAVGGSSAYPNPIERICLDINVELELLTSGSPNAFYSASVFSQPSKVPSAGLLRCVVVTKAS